MCPLCACAGIDRESLQGSSLSRLLCEGDGSALPTTDQQVTTSRNSCDDQPQQL